LEKHWFFLNFGGLQRSSNDVCVDRNWIHTADKITLTTPPYNNVNTKHMYARVHLLCIEVYLMACP
jgi:hypothetical protein